jgi:hypothetical protein
MKKQVTTTFKFLLITLLFISCQKEKSNETLNKIKPESYLYKKEVAKIINDSILDVAYIFENYSSKNSTEYFTVKVETPDSEAFIDIKILEWDPIISKIKESKGKGYGGSELKNLKLKIIDNGKEIDFIYQHTDEIID